MNIVQLQRLRQISADEPRMLPSPGQSGASGFGSALQDAVNKVDDAQKAADGQIEAFVAGEQENLHEVMIAMNEAKLSFQLMTEVRNRMLETYQELMRMQV
ncbi:MAG: flagellar hook-basal body complex protein FliE [Rhodothermales bacterium]